jgi:hypothetical protein
MLLSAYYRLPAIIILWVLISSTSSDSKSKLVKSVTPIQDEINDMSASKYVPKTPILNLFSGYFG